MIVLQLVREIPRKHPVIAKVHTPDDAGAVSLVEGDKLLRIAHRKVAKDDLVNQGEDGGIGTDAECNRQQGNGGKARTFRERAKANLHVQKKTVEDRLPSRRPDLMLDGVAAA